MRHSNCPLMRNFLRAHTLDAVCVCCACIYGCVRALPGEISNWQLLKGIYAAVSRHITWNNSCCPVVLSDSFLPLLHPDTTLSGRNGYTTKDGKHPLCFPWGLCVRTVRRVGEKGLQCRSYWWFSYFKDAAFPFCLSYKVVKIILLNTVWQHCVYSEPLWCTLSEIFFL